MKEHPLIFSAPMVRALLEGRKTQTRRVLKPQPEFQGVKSFGDSWAWRKGGDWFSGVTTNQLTDRFGLLHPKRCKYQPGDLIWVKEGIYLPWPDPGESGVWYRADGEQFKFKVHWKSPIFMPKWASRITLKIQNVRIERLQEITEREALDEGVRPEDWEYQSGECCVTSKEAFGNLWNPIHKKKPENHWDKNPWVAVLEFEVINLNINNLGDILTKLSTVPLNNQGG